MRANHYAGGFPMKSRVFTTDRRPGHARALSSLGGAIAIALAVTLASIGRGTHTAHAVDSITLTPILSGLTWPVGVTRAKTVH